MAGPAEQGVPGDVDAVHVLRALRSGYMLRISPGVERHRNPLRRPIGSLLLLHFGRCGHGDRTPEVDMRVVLLSRRSCNALADRGATAPPHCPCARTFSLAGHCILQDILWIQEALAGDASEELTLTRSARLARVGARASRLARLARVLRVLKVAKITLLAKTTGTRPEDPTDSDEDASADSLPGSITQLVSDTVTRHVVAIVLVSVIGAAALQFYEEDQAARSAFAVMTRASETSKLHQTQAVVESVPSIYYMSISKFADPLIDKREEQMYQDLRPSETVVYRTGPDDDCVNCVAMVDISVDKVSKAVLSMCLIILIVLVLVVATLSLSRETVQIVLEPTAKLVRVTRNSQALMSVFRAVADADSKHGVDETITTVLDAARKMLSAEVASIYFVDNDGNAKLHQCTWETEPDCRDAKGRLYEVCKGDLSITNAQTDTVVGSVINDAKQSADTEESANERKPFYANLLWVPDMDGVVDMKPRASAKKPRSLKRTVTRTVSQLTRSSTAAAQIDNDWTIRWQTDPSINEISLQMPTSGRKTVRNQLCMTIVAEVAGRRRVVGIVQALNRRVPKKRVRYEGSIQLTDLAFTQDDVKNLEVFCMQIADVIQMKLREVEYEDAKNRSDGVGALLRALELEHVGAATASPRRPPELTGEGSSRSLKKYAEAAIFSNRLSKPKESSLFPIDSLRRWGYSCLDHSVDDLVHCTVQMFEDLGLLHEFQIADANMLRFADKLLASYNEVPYHNAYHAFSVMQGCYVFCTTMKNGQHLQKGQQLALMVSALGHDSGHDGVNNAFHVACESELAILYNDLSPLENVHARRTLGVLKNEDIMVNVEERVKIKSMIVALILSTDMKFHKEKQEGLAKVCQSTSRAVFVYPWSSAVSLLYRSCRSGCQ